MLTQQENIERVKLEVDSILAANDHSVYVIVDGDRTLIPTDSTKYFMKFLELDFKDIKSIFERYGYTFDAFYNVALYYSKIEIDKYQAACQYSASCVRIYPEFLSFINAVRDSVQFIVVTSGLKQSWKNVIDNHSLEFMHLIGGSHFATDRFVVDKEAKGIIVKTLRNANKKVFAFGDTLIDFEMMQEADSAYLVVNERQNKDFVPVASEISHLQQISFSDYFHSDIPITDLNKVEEQILAF
jgi:soluble P-type ATPase